MGKIRVGIVFGGKSGEHEVSIRSAESIIANLDKSKYEVVKIFIDKNGLWQDELFSKIDVAFPIVHGTFGEDGSLQGLFEMKNIPYVGAGVLGSAIGMDKEITKRLLVQAGLLVARWCVLREGYREEEVQSAVKQLGWPVFVKPVNMGSSVGINKCKNMDQLKKAIKEAFKYDRKVIIEEFIKGREIECSVLGNNDLFVSLPGEIKPKNEFYDYGAKYIDEDGAEAIAPARLQKKEIKKIQEVALAAYKSLECRGMARVDMFLKDDGKVYINEINTLPGFTSISMYPKLWEVSGISYRELLDRLITLAIEEKESKDKLIRNYE